MDSIFRNVLLGSALSIKSQNKNILAMGSTILFFNLSIHFLTLSKQLCRQEPLFISKNTPTLYESV